MLRATLAAAVLSLLLVGGGSAAPAPPAAPARAAPAPVFTVSGRGYGHGVGMSQYGALGMAQEGFDYAAILAHYYGGTELGTASVASVRVLLAEGRASVRLASGASFRVRDAGGTVHEVAAGVHVLGVGMRLPTSDGPVVLRGPLRVTGGTAPIQLEGKRYRGTLEIASVRSRLRVVNVVGLEQYLFGVVPREVPTRWPAEALKAQAVAARSYALALRRSGPFDLYADQRSQVYGGMDAEQPPTSAAVLATAGEVLLHGGRVATTYFHSTSGGRTADVRDAWPGSAAVPYLVSVEDPHDAVSPHHAWGPVAVGAARLRTALGVRGPVLDVQTTAAGSGRVARVVGVGTGWRVSVPAARLRTALGLRSTWFQLGVLALDAAPRATVPFGSQLRLTGTARDVPAARLEQRAPGGAWAPAGAVVPGAGGAFAAVVTPQARTEYRLAAGPVRTGALAIAVAPVVRLGAPTTPSALSGTVRPIALAGTAVAVQRLEGGAWKRVAAATVDGSGAFTAAVTLTPGRYRAAVGAAAGYAAATSQPLDVVAP